MELKLKTAPPDEGRETIVDEHGALWRYSGQKLPHGIFPVTTKGSAGEEIHGYYKSGTLFMVNGTDIRNYFNSMSWRNRRIMHHM
jgi:hypothetical protein